MHTKIRKWLKTICAGAGIAAFLTVGVFTGIRVERSRQEALEMQKVHTSAVAVVNMDDGVMTERGQVNYASQLLSFPNGHFSVTGLSDAKAGVENGTYAAYIVIPETFSASVTSVENDPEKVTLTYQYNSRLSEEVKAEAVSDINTFIALFNSNIAYMYMDAIMAEFHRIQDESVTILSNDRMELELLANVDADRLIVEAQPVEEVSADSDIQPVELARYTTQNTEILNGMLSNYAASVQKGKDDYAAIKEENAAVGTASDQFFQLYDTVIQETAAEQAQSLAEGRERLTEAVRMRNQNIEDQETELRNTVGHIIELQLEADQNASESQLQGILGELEGRNDEAVKDLQQKWEAALLDLTREADGSLAEKKAVCGNSLAELVEEIYILGYNNALDDLDGELDSLKDGAGNIEESALRGVITGSMLEKPLEAEEEEEIEGFRETVEEEIDDISIDWEGLNVGLPDVSGNDPDVSGNNPGGGNTGGGNDPDSGGTGSGNTGDGNDPENGGDAGDGYEITLTPFQEEETINGIVEGTLALFRMETESEEIDRVIQTYFVDALTEESEEQKIRLRAERSALSQSMETYETRLADFEPMQYIEGAHLSSYLNDIESNTGEMLDSVEQNNTDYMLYATLMLTNTSEHTAQVRDAQKEANTQTAENVEDCIDELAQSRETVNSQNVDLLEGFTNSLRYTRVGSQGNAEVYDYIVNPVVSRTDGQAAPDAAAVSVMRKSSYVKEILIILPGIGIMACLAGLIFHFRQQNRKQPEEKEDVF